MDFAQPPRRPRAESIVPMINVVFLLLIFFLMTARIAPPEPFEVSPPETRAAEAADGTLILYVGADGQVGYSSLTGEPALEALIEETAEGPLILRADAALPGPELARLLARLRSAGIGHIDLLVQAGG
ncbi:biopolymer transporter ExbD [Algicella marina]|uniref:Biopolymer transporter ExbD n=2 Tax=Algicella marina TaxID=2683284 RepID=A0A6P1T639_9RHOB|nr:biopolymer transporter ExbD [Algicella marina]